MRVLIIGTLSGSLCAAMGVIRQNGAAVTQVDCVASALVCFSQRDPYDLIICDVVAGIRGLVSSLAGGRIVVPIIAFGAAATADMALQAVCDGAREFLPLPLDAQLAATILLATLDMTSTPIISDPIMLEILHQAEQVARSNASILITGESGTGKEVVARHIHRASKRSVGPFIALNCAAIPDQLLESELFGHERGAFSGAVARRVGKFEAAHGGTLLLDEISEMDIRLQAKLLRAIQEREIERLGGTGPVSVDVRILATSNRDISKEIQAGRFREDLYFRLNVINLRLPPLRERPADIPALASHYARHYAKVNALPLRPLSVGALARLGAHAWRGNVRELENTIHRAVLFASGECIEAGAIDLPPPVMQNVNRSTSFSSLVGKRVQDVECELILHTLSHTRGNRTHAAVILGISIRALRNKLRDYLQAGLQVPPSQPSQQPSSLAA